LKYKPSARHQALQILTNEKFLNAVKRFCRSQQKQPARF